MFSMTNVTCPRLDVAGLRTLADRYTSLASATTQTHQDTLAAAAGVMAANDGPGATAFNAKAVGPGSIGEHVGLLAEAANRTAAAYGTAATEGAATQTAMLLLARDREQQYWTALLQGTDAHALSLFVQVTRNDLLKLESHGTKAIAAAFSSLNLPTAFALSGADGDGRVDRGVVERWARLSDDERKKVLQRMVDAYADAQGFPRIRITFKELRSDDGVLWGQYQHGFPQSLELNSKLLSDPNIINTAIHEMQHRRQFTGMDWRWPWQDERNGMTRAEAERWRQLNSDHVRQKGGPGFWDYYPPRPIEVDARRAGRDYINNLSLDEFKRYET
jgi:hypothetical protein